MKALAEAGWELEDAIVGDEDNDVPSGIKNGGTNLTGFKMAVDIGAQFRVHLGIDVGGDVLPYVFAIDSHFPHLNNPLRSGAKPLSSGARCFCRSARARCNRTFTAPSEMPIAVAVSRTSISSMSLRRTTLR